MRAFFPVSEPAQADYETLRAAALAGTPLLSSVSARFERGGLAALVCSPKASFAAPYFVAELVGAARPAWTPYDDPREEVLAESYGLLVRTSGEASPATVTANKEA
jgi:hypothetical protein